MILAELTPDPTSAQIGTWVQILSILLNIAMMIVFLATINAKQKREVSFAGEPVDKKEFDLFKTEVKTVVDNIFAKLGGVERGVEARMREELRRLDGDARESRKTMHNELTKVREDVAGVQASQELMNQRLVQMDQKIDRLVETKGHR